MVNSAGKSVVVALGVFDGVHRGHQDLLSQAATIARQRQATFVVATFDPHPVAFLYPESFLGLLMPLERRIDLLQEVGADVVDVLTFNNEFAQLSPQAFIRDVLRQRIGADVVVVGENFRFGHKASGDVNFLTEFGQSLGIDVQVCSLSGDDHAWSSTRIRQALRDGDVATANALLGRPHRISGLVVHGNHRGRDLGFPTANITIAPNLVVPADGIYSGLLTCASGTYPAAVSIGTNPTFDDVNSHRIEAYVIGEHNLDLYDQVVDVDLLGWVRAMQTFADVEALIATMQQDVATCKAQIEAYSQ